MNVVESAPTDSATILPGDEGDSTQARIGRLFARSIESKGKLYFYLLVRLKLGKKDVQKVLCRLTPEEAGRIYARTSFMNELQKFKSMREQFEETQRSVERLSALLGTLSAKQGCRDRRRVTQNMRDQRTTRGLGKTIG